MIPHCPARSLPSRRTLHLLAFAGLACVLPATAAEPKGPALEPKEVIALFNGKDLSPFYTWLPNFGHVDPDRVFTVVDQIDGAPAIRVSGQHWGGFVTKENYANYRLLVEYRWGDVTWKPRENRARDSGILLHSQGEDGNYAKNFKSPWLRSIEFQIIEGGTGDLLVLNGYDRGSEQAIAPKVTTTVQANGKNWDPQGTPKEFAKGRIDWQYRDLGWKDVLGFRGPRDLEKTVGQWNLLEAVCDGGDLVYFVNGVKALEARQGTFKSGRLLFQSEGAEIFFRRIELHPLKKP
ncbi:MAG: DUF1080 domain-containing protein [Verrucomicrobia bacterium]|nr:DUF1080 domain-containing protein [Verrucomicrobiota bacterium]